MCQRLVEQFDLMFYLDTEITNLIRAKMISSVNSVKIASLSDRQVIKSEATYSSNIVFKS